MNKIYFYHSETPILNVFKFQLDQGAVSQARLKLSIVCGQSAIVHIVDIVCFFIWYHSGSWIEADVIRGGFWWHTLFRMFRAPIVHCGVCTKNKLNSLLACVLECVSVCVSACMCVCKMHACVCACIHACVCACMHACMCACPHAWCDSPLLCWPE